jgi:hypothetical protein
MSSVTEYQKTQSRSANSHDLLGQGTGPASLLNNSILGSKVPSTLHPSSFAKLDIRVWYCISLSSFKMSFFYSFKTDYEVSGNGLQVAQPLLVPYPPKYIRVHSTILNLWGLKTIIVELVIIKVIPNTHHAVYQVQQRSNECCSIHWVDYCNVICKLLSQLTPLADNHHL